MLLKLPYVTHGDNIFNQVFVYGTLRDPDTLSRLLRRVPPMKTARVDNYKKIFDQDIGYPTAVSEKGSFIDGSILQGIGARDLSLLDDYEHIRSGVYKRITVKALPVGTKTSVEVFMYVKGGDI